MGFTVIKRDLFTTAPSDVTSETYWIGDSEQLSVQILGGASDSTTTIQFTNVDGRPIAIAEGDWSTDTTIIGQDIFPVQTGACYIRVLSDATRFLLATKNGHY